MEPQFIVEQGRVLVPVGIPCLFGCTYCFTRNCELGPPRMAPQQIIERLRAFALVHQRTLSTIQLGYDSDPFAYPGRGIELLHRLCALGKHLNFSTKACIEGETLAGLAAVRAHLAGHLVLSALVSLSCWESAPSVEPLTPPPVQRMRTLRNLQQIGVPVLVAVQPVLPHIADAEYERLFEEALLAGCNGFILGPLYADEQARFIRCVPRGALDYTLGRSVLVPWSAHAPHWTRYEDEPRMQRLAGMAQEKGAEVFWSSAVAVDILNKRVLVGAKPIHSDPPLLEEGLVLIHGPEGIQALSNAGGHLSRTMTLEERKS